MGLVLVFGIQNLHQAAVGLCAGEKTQGVAGHCLWRRTHQGALGVLGSLPSLGVWGCCFSSFGPGCCFLWACPWWEAMPLLPCQADPCCPPIPQDAYNAVVRYFGESPKTTPPSVFFPVFVRFIRSYKVSRREAFKEEFREKTGRGREGWALSLGLFRLLIGVLGQSNGSWPQASQL